MTEDDELLEAAFGPNRIIAPGDARARGLKRYFTGQPCSRGHIAERQVSNGTCFACAKLFDASLRRRYLKHKNYIKNHDYILERERLRRKKQEYRERHCEYDRKFRLNNGERLREAERKWSAEKTLALQMVRQIEKQEPQGEPRPCKHGHVGYRDQFGACFECKQIARQKSKLKNPEDRRKVSRPRPVKWNSISKQKRTNEWRRERSIAYRILNELDKL